MDPKHKSGYRLGIVNPTTLVGNEVKSILRERSFPFERVVLLDSTGKEAGAITEVGDEPAVVTAISDDELEDLDLVFFCGSSATNREWITRHSDDAFVAIDLSQPITSDSGRAIVAEVNIDAISQADGVIVSPHPVALPLALILHQISTVTSVESCVANVIEPASMYDHAGVEELAKQTISVLNVQSVPQTVFDRQLAFNLYPATKRNEELVVRQVKTLIDPRIELALLVTQGTIFHNHTFSLFIRTAGDVDDREITAALRKSSAIAFAEGDQQFGTIDAAGRNEILIAEVRPEASIGGRFWVWAVCDNLRRGSALNAVLIAENVLFGNGAPN